MEVLNQEARWLLRGCQRQAIAKALYKPLTEQQILERAQAVVPRLRLRDLWLHLEQFRENKLAQCLTPRITTAKVYCLTDQGRVAVANAFGQTVEAPPSGIDWNRYAFVVRGRLRRLIVMEMAQPSWRDKEKTPVEIRKGLIHERIALDHARRALRDLEKIRLTRVVPVPDDKRSKRYILTPMGRKIAVQLDR